MVLTYYQSYARLWLNIDARSKFQGTEGWIYFYEGKLVVDFGQKEFLLEAKEQVASRILMSCPGDIGTKSVYSGTTRRQESYRTD